MINRYECFTGHEATNYDATVTEDGPWVSYDDHAEEIATLRAENERLVDEAYNARQAAKGENALRLEAERERMNGQIQKSRSIDTLCSEIERWVKEVAHLKLAAEKTERERMREELTFE